MKAKLEMLKDLLSQMQVLMADGHGEDADAGAETMEAIGDEAGMPCEGEEEDVVQEEEGDDIKSAVRDAFKGKPAAPARGGALEVRVAAHKEMPKAFAAKKKGKGLKYG